ncbi:DUF6770 family protein [Flavobacterium sp.]|uniref:DUF6770 family protein n=1 Tax=Flavobacterium sp. TaxID=239 RepID=UPI003C38B35F
MKKTILLFLLLLFPSLSQAQSYTVLNNTAGEFESFLPIYDHQTLYGYVEVRRMNIDEEKNVTFKYYVLDKNFNTICTGDLVEKQSWPSKRRIVLDAIYANGYIQFEFSDRWFVLGSFQSAQNTIPDMFRTYQRVDIKNNKITHKGIYNDEIIEVALKYLKKDKLEFNSYSLDESGFLIVQKVFSGKNKLDNKMYCLNFKNEKVWEYSNDKELKSLDQRINVLDYDKNYVILSFYRPSIITFFPEYNIAIIDAKTGKEIFCLTDSKEYTLYREYHYIKGNRLYVGGRFFKKSKKGEYDYKKFLGVFQQVVDIDKKEVIQDKFIKYQEFKDVNINEFGRIKDESFLYFKKYSVNPDGSSLVIANTNWNKVDSRSYFFLFDKNFNPVKTIKYDFNSSKNHYFGFTQLLPNNYGRSYFYFDKNSDKEVEVNILNYYYKSQKLTAQKMPLTNKESSIDIFPAKEGYIGIAEYFKNPEKTGKHMEIRLEKINFEREK